jgi:murein L,D-transpeptidase YafK
LPLIAGNPYNHCSMRLHARPEYLLHKAFHRTLVSLSVWRNNKSVADAFRDPAMLDSVYNRWKRAPRRARRMRLAAAAAVGAIAFAVFHPGRAVSKPGGDVSIGSETPRVATPALPAIPVPTAHARTAHAPVMPPAPAAQAKALVTPPASAAPAPAAPGVPGAGYVLVACKRDRTLYVYKREDAHGAHWNRTAAFPMAVGRNSGDKGRSGDLRTPEGRFWITGLVSGRVKGAAYGPLVFTLNYPRPGDLAEGKSGQGIWIHGVEAGKLPSFTHGCLSLSNEDVLALAAYADAGTPVVILSDSLSPDPERQVDFAGMEREYPTIVASFGRKTRADSAAREAVLKEARAFVAKEAKDFPELAMQALSEEDRKAVLARLDQWRADWSNRAIEAYASNYDPSFRDREGRDRQAFLDRKRRIFATKSKIDMEIRDPRIESESYSRVKVTFRQDYLAEGPQGTQRSSEPKSLRLEEGPQGWLIISE